LSVRYFSQQNPRLRHLLAIITLGFIALGLGLAWRQLGSYAEFRLKEEKQNLRRIVQPAPRGQILDRNGVVLVGNRPRFSAVVYLNDLRGDFDRRYSDLINAAIETQLATGDSEPLDWEALRWQSRLSVLQQSLDTINQILGTEHQLRPQAIKDHFYARRILPLPLVADLPEAHYAILLNALPIGSRIDIFTDTARAYPQGSLAAHVMGYVRATRNAPEASELITRTYVGTEGVSGLEKQFDQLLSGQSGVEVCVVDRFGYSYERIEEKSFPPQQGSDLVTSLDSGLQRVAENALGDKVGAVVALDVNSGEVLALASKPDYDLRHFTPRLSHKAAADITERGAWLNRATQGAYPPGSTFKMVTAIAALRAGLVEPFEILMCGAFLRVGTALKPEHSGRAYGAVDLPKALEKSSNVYMYKIALEAGIERIAAEARRFGFDQQTGIELPYETSRMQVPDKAWSQRVRGYGWVPGDTTNVAIGQGDLLASPLQVAAYTASLARRQTRTAVTVLKRPEGTPVDHQGEPIGLSDEQHEAILQGMKRATGPDGTARFLTVPGLQIAAKTGTAQVKIPGRKLTLAWVVAFAPADDPQLAVTVLVEGQNPGDNYAGGGTAAPIARQVFEHWRRFQQR
jgi:penicillin-binding protein 2